MWNNAERASRQSDLNLDTGNDRLEQPAIEFFEKFRAAGQTAKYIRMHRFEPTNDFIWLELDEREFEQKTTKADYWTIHGRIVDAASRARNNPHKSVIKENFIIDIMDADLTTELRSALKGYNNGRIKYRLRELWIMSHGQLFRICLAA